MLKPTILSSSKSWLICTRIANNAEQRGIAALLYNVSFKYHLMVLKVDFWGEEFILYLSVSNGADRKRRSKVMKKFICNRNGKAVFQEGDRELVAAYQMKSSPVPVTPRKLKAEMEAIARTAR